MFTQEELVKLVGRTVEFEYPDSNNGELVHRTVAVEKVALSKAGSLVLTGTELSRGYKEYDEIIHKSYTVGKVNKLNIMSV